MMPSCAAHQAGHPVILGLSVKMGFYPLLLPLTPTWWLEEHRRVWISQERERERERKRESLWLWCCLAQPGALGP